MIYNNNKYCLLIYPQSLLLLAKYAFFIIITKLLHLKIRIKKYGATIMFDK